MLCLKNGFPFSSYVIINNLKWQYVISINVTVDHVFIYEIVIVNCSVCTFTGLHYFTYYITIQRFIILRISAYITQ